MPQINKIKRPWIKRSSFTLKDNKFYHSSQWRKLRNSYIKNNPLCIECKKEGKLTPTEIIDHIKPINPENGWDLQDGKYPNPMDISNLQSLCKKHHYSKMAKASNK